MPRSDLYELPRKPQIRPDVRYACGGIGNVLGLRQEIADLKLMEYPEMIENESPNNEYKRSDWRRSHALIERSIVRSIEKDGRLPTYREIEVETGLSQATIARHRPGQMFEEMRMMSRFLGAKVLEQQALRAFATGKAKDAELYFKLNFDWKR